MIGNRHATESERGSSLVEFSLALPILMMIVIMTIDLGHIIYTSMALLQAARAGAAYGAQDNGKSGNFSGMSAAATNAASSRDAFSGCPMPVSCL